MLVQNTWRPPVWEVRAKEFCYHPALGSTQGRASFQHYNSDLFSVLEALLI